MKVYYVCDACELVIGEEETEGEGLVFLRTMCDDCARELGLFDENRPLRNTFYN